MTEILCEPRRRTAGTARYAEKKKAIVAAASDILNHHGVKGMTLAGVASRVGLITTSVTYYFKKKEDLAVACYLDGIARCDALATDALRMNGPLARVHRLLDAGITGQENIPSVSRAAVKAILLASSMRILLFLAGAGSSFCFRIPGFRIHTFQFKF